MQNIRIVCADSVDVNSWSPPMGHSAEHSLPKKVCPKCGFLQNEGEECGRCGIVFRRYQAVVRTQNSMIPEKSDEPARRERVGWLRRSYRIFRWATLVSLVMILVLILCPSQPPQIAASAAAAERAEVKVREFRSATHAGRSRTIEMDEAELNGWLGSNLAIQHPADGKDVPHARTPESAISLAKKVLAPEANADPTLEQVQSSVRDVKIELRQNSLRAYVLFELFGKDLSLELEGQLMVRDGCLRLETTGGKLGSLPLLAGSLEGATQRLFDSPENREKFRLPPQIRDVHVEAGRLVISSR
jgi:hypothetical protein